jgi:3-oxoacyl-[acyl-carrier-protein] synthase-1
MHSLQTEHGEQAFAVTGWGMVTSLGLDANTSCAAARAGLSRAVGLDHFRLKAPDGDVLGIRGHSVPILADGFEGFARLVRLAQGGLSDLMRDLSDRNESEAHAGSTGFYMSIPDPLRRFTGLLLIADAELRSNYERRSCEVRAIMTPAMIASQLLRQAAELADWRGKVEIRYVASSGHTGVAEAMKVAIEDLYSGQVSQAIVGGIDSLVDEHSLQWLNDTARLKTPNVAAGLQPGEAAAFLSIERYSSTGATRHLGLIETLQFALETNSLISGKPPLGDGLSRVLSLVGATGKAGEAAWLVTDQNGELYRAYDWGHAVTRLRPFQPSLNHPLWYSAEAFGDTGAASGAVSLALALWGFQRDFAPSRSAIVASSADGPERSAVLISAPVDWR